MKITQVRTILVDRFLFVEVETDTGLVGLGEGGAWAFQEATATAVEKLTEYLIGQDPRRIEHHWQYMYRWAHFRGSVIMAALSAVDIALWDILGQSYRAPVHALLGGKIRHKARCYYHVFGETKEQLYQGIEDARRLGFTAVGHLTPFLDSPRDEPYYESHARKIGDAVETVRRYREIAGPDVDLCIEIHRRLNPYEAIQFGRAIEPYTPLFLEDPVTPDNFDEMGSISEKIGIPLATGERLTSLWEFQMLLKRKGAQLIRPDVCLVGGITGARKIAALAEAQHVGIVPHNPLSVVSTVACLQIAATAPNFVLQELPAGTWSDMNDKRPEFAELVEGAPRHDGAGYLMISDEPGLGIRLKPDAAERFPFRKRSIKTRLGTDGAVVDQ